MQKTKENNAQRIVKNTGFLFIRTILVLVVSLYTSRVVLRVLGFEDFGLYNVVGSVVVFFTFLQTALTNATYRYLAYELGKGNILRLKQVFSMAINSHILLALTVFVILEILGLWFVNNMLNINPERLDAANWTFHFSVLTFCINIIRTPFNSSIIAHEHMNFYALISIIEVFLRLGIVFMLGVSPIDKLISYAALLALVSFVVLICYIGYCHYYLSKCSYIRYWDGNLLKQFSAYSSWSLLVNVSDVATTQSMSILFFNYLGAVANAALGIANQVIGGLTMFLGTFTQAFNPQIIKNYAAGNYETFLKMIYSTSKISYLLLLLLSVPVLANIHYVLNIWLDDYPEMTPTFIQMIIIYSLIDATQSPLWTAVHATGNIRTHQILMSSIKILAIPSIWLCLYFWGSGIMAIAIWSSLNFVCAIVRTLYMRKLINLNIKYYLSQVILKIVIISTITVPVAFLLVAYIGQNFLGFLVSSISTLLLMMIICYKYGLNCEERVIIKSMPIYQKVFTHIIRKEHDN